jgi:hypothetical protein
MRQAMKNIPRQQSITIGFSTTRLFISGLIRWATRSSCSHAFIAFYDRDLNMRMVMQAQSWGFELRPWNRWKRENILVAEFRPASNHLDQSLCNIAHRLGTKFNYRSAVLIGIRSLFSSWYKNRFTLNINQSPWKLTCSEAVIRFLHTARYKTVRGLDPETTSPGRLLREILQNKDEFKPVHLNKNYLIFDRVLGKTMKPRKSKKRS